MIENTSRISRHAKVFCAAMITLYALLGPVKSYAQSDQVIVMVCTMSPYPFRNTYTIDLARKTVEEVRGGLPTANGPISEGPFPGTVTQIADQQILFSVGTETFTLNRYTGDLAYAVDGVSASSMWTCQKQQKQF